MPKISKFFLFNKREIAQLFRTARRVARNSSFDLLAAPRKHDFSRILIVTSSAVGTAPERNLFRRRIKEIFYTNKLYEKRYDYIIIAKKEAIAFDFDQLKELFISTLERADKKMELVKREAS